MIFTLMSCMCEVASSLRLKIGESSLRAEEAACLSHLEDCPGLGSQREDTAHLIKDKVPLTEGHLSLFFSLSPGSREDWKKGVQTVLIPHSNKPQRESERTALLTPLFFHFYIYKSHTLRKL